MCFRACALKVAAAEVKGLAGAMVSQVFARMSAAPPLGRVVQWSPTGRVIGLIGQDDSGDAGAGDSSSISNPADSSESSATISQRSWAVGLKRPPCSPL